MKDSAQHGWKEVSLGEICEKTETVDPRKTPRDEFEYVDVSSVSNETFTIGETQKLLGEDAPSRARRQIRSGDILFATIRPTLQRIAQVPEHLDGQVCSTGYIVLRPRPALDARFLMHSLFRPDFMQSMETLQSGASYPAVTDRQVRAQKIPLPPLEEQQRIVAVLDKAFEGLARARAHTEANLQNSQELFESKRKDLLSANDSDWGTKSLNEVCIVERGSSPRPIKSFLTEDNEGVNWVKIGDTKVGSKYVTSTKEKITKKGAEKSRAVHIGDFILTNSMTYGRPYIMGIDGYIHDGWFVLRLKDGINSDFFFHLLSSTVVQDQFEQLAAGSVVKNISSDLVKKAVFKLPPLEEQKAVAAELDRISDKIELIASGYKAKLQDLDELRQSLLQKAFAGELT